MRTRSQSIKLEAPRRISLSQVVVDQILRLIQEGQLRPGDQMPSEAEMTRMLNVGRSSVREGLRGLSILGVIETSSGRATTVSLTAKSPLDHIRNSAMDKLRVHTLLDLLEVRESLEGQAAYLAAERAGKSDLMAIRSAANQVAKDVSRRKVYFQSNAAFHLSIARASQNRILEKSISLLIGQVRDLRVKMMKALEDMPERDVAEHAAILEAIAAREPAAARRAMMNHIRSFVALIEAARLLPGDTGRRAGGRR
jgi:GntR family transcriptional repressor for pyruvate dehydrogenase complex